MTGYTPWTVQGNPDYVGAINESDVISLASPLLFVSEGKVPWRSFRYNHDYHGYRNVLCRDAPDWLYALDQMRDALMGVPVYLSLEIVGNRMDSPDPWVPFPDDLFDEMPSVFLKDGVPSFQVNKAQRAVRRLCEFMMWHFEPIAFTPFVEMNTVRHKLQNNLGEWSGIRDTYGRIVPAMRDINSATPVFLTWQWDITHDNLNKPLGPDLIRNVNDAGDIDIVAASIYPRGLFGEVAKTFEQYPQTFCQEAFDVFGHKGVVISEMGWATPEGTPEVLEDQRQFVEHIVSEAKRLNMMFAINYFLNDQSYTWTENGVEQTISIPIGLCDDQGLSKPAHWEF
jgi:hypothetical protein